MARLILHNAGILPDLEEPPEREPDPLQPGSRSFAALRHQEAADLLYNMGIEV